MTKFEFYISVLFLICILAIVIPFINEAFSTSKVISEPYVVTEQYCAVNYPSNPALCMAYDTVTETRVDTEVKGLLYNTTSYKVLEN